MIEPRIRRTCEQPKSLSEFRKAPTRFGGDGYSKDCKDCLALARAQRRAARDADQEPPHHQQDERGQNPTLAIPMCMEVDAEWDGTDFVLTQDNEGTTMTIYLAPHALRRLWLWAEELAQQQHAQQEEPNGGVSE